MAVDLSVSRAWYTASGIDWVTPGKLPAKVMVAPNSPRARAQQSTAPATSEGPTRGKVIRLKVVHCEAPSVEAASSNRPSRERNAPSMVMIKNGIATKVSAMTTPAVVNGNWIPRAVYSHCPTNPRRPKAVNKMTPETTGGSSSGTITMARSTRVPGKISRASSQASGVPIKIAIAVAATEVTNEIRNASKATCEVKMAPNEPHGASASNPTNGITRKAIATRPGIKRNSGLEEIERRLFTVS